MTENIMITTSRGNSKFRFVIYIRPHADCFNKGRRITAQSKEELDEKIKDMANKWYTPLIIYRVDNHRIASNSEENALREYWRVCEKEVVGLTFPVTLNQL
jgi:hypothetical protein